ncbi:MAG: pilus assembly protein PilM, partial [Planctomycetaceae bacterium]|nr:pilus assembly protein PilM [Planctomycetaceae bacterium]
LSLPEATATAVAHELLRSRIQCQSIDGLPFTIARAVTAMETSTETRAALDWGASTATFVLIRDGRPVFTRQFPQCGFSQITEGIQQRLDLPFAECHRLVQAIGMFPEDVCSMSSVSRLVSKAVEGTIRGLSDEIRCTLRFLKSQSEICPQKLTLLGGGASIRQTCERLSELTGLSVSPWTFPKPMNFELPEQGMASFANAYAATIGAVS